MPARLAPIPTLPASEARKTPPMNSTKPVVNHPPAPSIGPNAIQATTPPTAPITPSIRRHQGSGSGPGGLGPIHQPGHLVPHQPIMAANAYSISSSLLD